MDFYGTEICFKTLLKVLIFAEISDPRQKFLLNCLSWSKSIWGQNANFQGVPPRLVEISGRQNWANVGNLAHFAQNATNVEKWWFLTFLKILNFWKFLLQKSKISKISRETQKFLPTSKIWKNEQLYPKYFFETPGYFFISSPQNIHNFM